MGNLLKALRCFLICLALFVCLISLSCSSGSSHNNITSEDVVQTLDSYDFTMTVFDNSDTNHKTLSSQMAINSKPAVVTIDTSEPITGNYTVKDEKYTINGLPNQFKMTITMNDGSSTTFTMQLIDSIVSTGSALPTEGTFRLFFGGDYITVSFINSPKRVNIIYGADSQTFTWQDIDNLLGSSTNQLQQEAALAATLMSLLMDQINLVVFTNECMYKYKFTDGKEVSIPSDTFPPSNLSTTPENLWLTWIDTNKDTKLGGGDSFSWVFTKSWEYDSAADVGLLYSTGIVNMKNYTEDIQSIDDKDTLKSFGFPKDAAVSDTGVFYDNLDIVKTLNVTDKMGTSIRLNGGFWINFQG